MAESESGRWVTTFGADTRPGDKIRRAAGAPERRIVTRDYPPSTHSMFRVEYAEGGESIGKSSKIQIWDPDGSVSERVMDISARAAEQAAGR